MGWIYWTISVGVIGLIILILILLLYLTAEYRNQSLFAKWLADYFIDSEINIYKLVSENFLETGKNTNINNNVEDLKTSEQNPYAYSNPMTRNIEELKSLWINQNVISDIERLKTLEGKYKETIEDSYNIFVKLSEYVRNNEHLYTENDRYISVQQLSSKVEPIANLDILKSTVPIKIKTTQNTNQSQIYPFSPDLILNSPPVEKRPSSSNGNNNTTQQKLLQPGLKSTMNSRPQYIYFEDEKSPEGEAVRNIRKNRHKFNNGLIPKSKSVSTIQADVLNITKIPNPKSIGINTDFHQHINVMPSLRNNQRSSSLLQPRGRFNNQKAHEMYISNPYAARSKHLSYSQIH